MNKQEDNRLGNLKYTQSKRSCKYFNFPVENLKEYSLWRGMRYRCFNKNHK